MYKHYDESGTFVGVFEGTEADFIEAQELSRRQRKQREKYEATLAERAEREMALQRELQQFREQSIPADPIQVERAHEALTARAADEHRPAQVDHKPFKVSTAMLTGGRDQ